MLVIYKYPQNAQLAPDISRINPLKTKLLHHTPFGEWYSKDALHLSSFAYPYQPLFFLVDLFKFPFIYLIFLFQILAYFVDIYVFFFPSLHLCTSYFSLLTSPSVFLPFPHFSFLSQFTRRVVTQFWSFL